HLHMHNLSAITAACTWSRAGRRRAYRAPKSGAGSLPAPDFGARYARRRPARDQVQAAVMAERLCMWRCCLVSLSVLWLAAASPASAYVAYVSNEKGNTVSVIDTDKWALTATIKVGQRPRGIGFTKDGKFVMVAVGDDDTIQMIDTKTQQVADTLPSGPDPELFTQDAAGKILYVANENDNTVTVIDIAKRTRLGDIQVGV